MYIYLYSLLKVEANLFFTVTQLQHLNTGPFLLGRSTVQLPLMVTIVVKPSTLVTSQVKTDLKTSGVGAQRSLRKLKGF